MVIGPAILRTSTTFIIRRGEVDLDEIYYYRIEYSRMAFALPASVFSQHGKDQNAKARPTAIPCWCTAGIIRWWPGRATMSTT